MIISCYMLFYFLVCSSSSFFTHLLLNISIILFHFKLKYVTSIGFSSLPRLLFSSRDSYSIRLFVFLAFSAIVQLKLVFHFIAAMIIKIYNGKIWLQWKIRSAQDIETVQSVKKNQNEEKKKWKTSNEKNE